MDTVNRVRPENEARKHELDLMDVAIILAKNKRTLLTIPFVVAVVATAGSLLMPNEYKANTKILPPQQAQSGAAALLAQLGGVAGAAASAAGVKNPNDLYIGMLKSRSVVDRIISKYDLKKVYDEETLEKTRKKLEENTAIASGKDNLINVEVEDTDPKRAAAMANSYAEELLRLTKVIAITEASQRRLFFERQLASTKDNLANAENSLRAGLDTHGVISVDADSRAVVETASRLRAQIAAKEIQLSSMQAFVTENNNEYKKVREELASLRLQFNRLRTGGEAEGSNDANANAAGLENIKLVRDVKYHQMLYELLAKQYEVARLDEAKDASIIQVLDVALVPEKKAKPLRALIVAVSTALAFFMAAGLVLLRESRRREKEEFGSAARWNELKSYLKFRSK